MYSGDILLMKVEETMLHLRHNSILMTAEIPMSPKSTDDWVETLQTRSIPLMVSNALRLDIYGPCEFCCISMLMKKQREGHSRHSERLRSKVASDRVYHHNTLPERHACTMFVHTPPPQRSTEQPTEREPTRRRPFRHPKSKYSQAAE
jgi:hypothetical protein